MPSKDIDPDNYLLQFLVEEAIENDKAAKLDSDKEESEPKRIMVESHGPGCHCNGMGSDFFPCFDNRFGD